MMDRELLRETGIDYEDGLARFMNNTQLYEKFLLRFLDDTTFPDLLAALDQGDADLAFRAAHTLKGVAGNLSLRGLLAAVEPLVEALRRQSLEEARTLLPQAEAAYGQTCAVIRTAG